VPLAIPAHRAVLLGGTFNPTRIPNLRLWMSAVGLPGLVDNAPVTTWADLSPSNSPATQATSAKKPTFKTGVQGGQPGVLFDATDDHLLQPLAVGGAKTIILAYKLAGVPGASTVYSALSLKLAAGTWCELDFFNFAGYEEICFKHDMGSVAAAAVGIDQALDTNAHILTHTYNGGTNTSVGSYAARLDGVAKSIVTTGNMGRADTDKGAIGARVTSADVGSLMFNGYLFSVLVYTRVLAAFEIQNVERYVGAKYGITVA
jgi:hypothetical protein